MPEAARGSEQDERAQAWHAAIKLGDEQIERGEGVPYTPQRLDAITERAKAAVHSGQPLDADVLP